MATRKSQPKVATGDAGLTGSFAYWFLEDDDTFRRGFSRVKGQIPKSKPTLVGSARVLCQTCRAFGEAREFKMETFEGTVDEFQPRTTS